MARKQAGNRATSGGRDALAALVAERGPFASLYLDTRADVEEAPKQIELRWQALRESLLQKGAAEAALTRLDEVVEGAYRAGDGLCALATSDEIVFHQSLSTPIGDGAQWGPAPSLLPLLEWRQDNPTYAVALVDRTGAEIEVTSAWRPEYSTAVEGDDWPVRRISPGGWSQRRYQKRAENLWEENAKEIAAALEKIAAEDGIELVIVSGDVRAVAFLRDHLSGGFDAALYELEGTQAQAIEDIAEEVHKAVVAHSAQATEAVLERFREERGQADRAVEGAGQTARALSEARVETLIVARRDLGGTVYAVTEDPTQVSTDRRMLTDLQLGEVVEVPLVDALVRSALAGGSEVRVVPSLSEEHAPADGVGAILRYTYR